MKKFLTIFAVAALALTAAVSCTDKEDEETTVDLKGISLSASSLDLFVGDDATLTVKYTPEDATTKPKATWTSSNETVATVSEGKVTALAAGETTITATVEKFTATCSVKVSAKDDYTGPVEGNSAWSVVGTLLESSWGSGEHGDYVCAEADGAFVLKNVRLAETDEIKFRKDKDWAVNRGVAAIELGVPVKAEQDGGNIKLGQAGLFDLYYFAEKEAIVIVAKDAALPEIPNFAEPEDDWDYTPSAAYTADDNIWKAVDAANNVAWYYNPNWAGEKPAPETSFKESTWTVKLDDEDNAAEWTTQMFIKPATDLLLDTQKKYTFTATVYSSTGTHVFFKMYQDQVNTPFSFETAGGADRIAIAAGETKEIKVENFIPLGTPQMLLIDFAQHAANNTIHVKDITLKVTGEVEKPVDWDYTPSAEYTAAENLWKPVFDANGEQYYYYHCVGSDWNGTDTIAEEVPFLTKTQSTYELNYEDATASSWQNQFFIFPKAGHEVALKADKTYTLKVTIGTNQSIAPGFFKIEKYNAENPKREGETIWEAGSLSIEGAKPLVLEHEITGVECANINLVMDFGGNPANTKIYIKDIILTEKGGSTPPAQDLITIDGNFDDWANIAGVSNGSHGMFKFAVDQNNAYFYTWRTTEGRFSELWGVEKGYVYFAFNLDNDPATGESLNGNGPYEFIGYIYCFGGSADAPEIKITAAGNAAPSPYTVSNVKVNGKVDENGAYIEYSIPLSDIPALPAEFDVISWGNKDLSKVTMHYPYVPEPALPATVAEIIEKIPAEATGSSTAVEFEANLTSPAVVTYVNGKNAYIEDATGAILLFLADHGLAAGDTIKGKIAIKAYWYNGIPETVVAFGDAAEIAHGDAPAPKEMTIAQLLANYDANLLRYIVIKDVKVTDGIADGDRNGAIAQADGSTIAVYAQINNGGLVLEEGATGDFVTIPAYYKTNKQVYLWDNAWFTKAAQGSTGEDLGGSDDVNPWN